VTITANLSLAEKSTEKILFKEPSFVFRQPYTVPGSSKAYYDREREAIEALARPFAQSSSRPSWKGSRRSAGVQALRPG